MREHLLGYLLGALDGSEHELVKRQLENDPQLRCELQQLELRLVPLEGERWQHDPPPGLAQRTCELVSRYRRGVKAPWLSPARGSSPSEAERAGSVRTGCRMADVVVAAGIFFAAAMFFFPAIADSRIQAHVVLCSQNLHALGEGLSQYSKLHGGHFPHVPATGKLAFAGIFAPKLFDAGFLADQDRLICPASAWAERRDQFQVPTLSQVKQSTGRKLARLHWMAGGSYGYTLGYMDGERYVPVHDLGRAYFALMSDAPRSDRGQWNTGSHGGRGFNVLFEDMHVRFIVHVRCEATGLDDVFRNDHGKIEPGVHQADSVISPSPVSPFHVYWMTQR